MAHRPAFLGASVLVPVQLRDEIAYRPAIVVRVWGPETVNVVVFKDGTNDHPSGALIEHLTSQRHHAPAAGEGLSLGTWCYESELPTEAERPE